MPKSLKFEDQYPELDKVAEDITIKVALMINEAAPRIKSNVPYKAQAILEQVIKKLKERV